MLHCEKCDDTGVLAIKLCYPPKYKPCECRKAKNEERGRVEGLVERKKMA